MIKAEWTNKDSLDLQPTCNQVATKEGDNVNRADAIKCIKWGEGVTDAIRRIEELPSADRPTGEFDGYTGWLEEKLLECEPSILCSVVSNEQDEWCEKNCENMRPECLRKCYKICKGEIL